MFAFLAADTCMLCMANIRTMLTARSVMYMYIGNYDLWTLRFANDVWN